MKKFLNFFYVFLLLACATVPKNLARRLEINLKVTNSTTQYGLDFQLEEKLISQLEPAAVVSENEKAKKVEIEVTSYKVAPLVYNEQGEVTEYELKIGATLRTENQSKNFEGRATFSLVSVPVKTEQEASDEALSDLAAQIADYILSQ